MAKATKTIKQPLGYQAGQADWFAATKDLFNQIAAFYFEVIQAHAGVLDLDTKTALTALEKLTHTTKENPHPVMPLSTIAEHIPAMFRRAAIHAALGSARSFHTTLAIWRKQKEKAIARGKKFTIRPPVPPRTWNKSVTLYAGQWKERTSTTIMLKVWTGRSWAWVKCRLQGRDLPEGWEIGSAQLVQHAGHWWLHTPLEQARPNPGNVEKQITSNPDTRLCSVDLNISTHLAVCSILTTDGTVLATLILSRGFEVKRNIRK